MNAKENMRIFGRGLAWSTIVAVPLTLVMLDGLRKCEEMAIRTEAAQCGIGESQKVIEEKSLLSQKACRVTGEK